MACRMRPSEELPTCEVGDRIIGIVRYREQENSPLLPHVIILLVLETGYYDLEDGGYDIHDCELWTMEKDLVKIANFI